MKKKDKNASSNKALFDQSQQLLTALGNPPLHLLQDYPDEAVYCMLELTEELLTGIAVNRHPISGSKGILLNLDRDDVPDKLRQLGTKPTQYKELRRQLLDLLKFWKIVTYIQENNVPAKTWVSIHNAYELQLKHEESGKDWESRLQLRKKLGQAGRFKRYNQDAATIYFTSDKHPYIFSKKSLPHTVFEMLYTNSGKVVSKSDLCKACGMKATTPNFSKIERIISELRTRVNDLDRKIIETASRGYKLNI